MSYSTEEDIRIRLTAANWDEVDHELSFDAGIEWADSVIDAHLSSRYEVPFASPVPTLIKHISADLATYHTLRNAFTGDGQDRLDNIASTIKRDAMGLLKKLADGDIALASSVPDSSMGNWISNTWKTTPVVRDFDLQTEFDVHARIRHEEGA